MARPSVSPRRPRPDKNLFDTEYSLRARLLIALAKDLTALGGDLFELDIPRMAFIGNQSAGKSSLVEAATGIAAPRDSGTCTRCPMQCTVMRSDGPWSCTISLNFLYDEKGNPLKIDREVSFPTIYDPKDVEIWLRRAQAAILMPRANPLDFHNKSVEELKGMQAGMIPFSWNKVEVLVRDPEGANLSFVDLPGIIQHHRADTEVVPFVKKLTERFIKSRNTLIVVTVPMTDDFENQGAFELATHADPEGLRTIGVGTKPDMLTPGNTSALDKWRDILEGTTSNLRHGYYCVKLPSDKEREEGHSRSELEKREKAFFSSTEPWKSLDNQTRLGMRNFVENTSMLLIGLIENNLPNIKKRVDKLLAKDTRLLAQLPELFTADNPIAVILLRVTAFCKTLQGTIGGKQRKDFVRNNRSRHRTWELPGYVPFEATKEIILQHVEHWEDPLIRCFNDISKNTLDLISSLVHDPEYFGRFAELVSFVETVIGREAAALQAQVSDMLRKKFNMENSSPLSTANLDRFNQERSTWLNQIYRNISQPIYSDEHKVMADVHAYFHIASARFIDVVVLCIEEEWHKKLAVRLEESLIEKIPPLPRETLNLLLGEDPKVSKQRNNLIRRIEQLTKIKERLAQYEAQTLEDNEAWGAGLDGLN
ncbi:hypothetical protein MD484_g1512, partial [Candolleomyces efflorescens]